MDNAEFKYFAFISYNSHDIKWGKRLQRKLENYRMPTTLCSKYGWAKKPIRPVFFAPTDIQPGGLTPELQERLRMSRNLIVICSPHSAKSVWVGREIEFFHSLGRTQNIYFFIVDGVPNSGDEATECFNPVVRKLGIHEVLGANIHEKVYKWPWMNRERAYVQLITKLLGIEFDMLWQRHKRLLIRQRTIAVIFALIVLIAPMVNRPVDVSVRLNDVTAHNNQLPPLKDAILTIMLDNETKTDTIATLEDMAVFTNIPYHFIGKDVRILFSGSGYEDLDSTVTFSKDITINVCRNDSVYGLINFRLWNSHKSEFVENCDLEIAGRKVSSDENGRVSLFIPLAEQKPKYCVRTSVPLEKDTLYMPCGEDDIIEVK